MKRLSYFLVVMLLDIFLGSCKKDDSGDRPQLSTISQNGASPGEGVVINGINLSTATAVKFGSKSVPPRLANPGSVVARVPADMQPGMIQLSVITSEGESNSLPFTILPPAPIILFMQPASGVAGDVVTLKGTNFLVDTKVFFPQNPTGRVEAQVVSLKANELTIKIPEGAKSGSLIISNAGKEVISHEVFTIIGVPSNLSIYPPKASAGSLVTITGTDLEATSVSFNQFQSAIESVSADRKEIKVKVPDLPVGVVSIVITSPVGSTENIPFEVISTVPIISSVLPFVAYAGDAILITGFNFGTNGAVKFNEVPGQVVSNTSTEIITKIPPGVSAGELNVVVSAETGTSVGFTITLLAGTPQMPGGPPIVVIPPTPGAGNLSSVSNSWRNKYDPDHTITLSDQNVEVGDISGTENHTTIPEYDGNSLTGKIDKINKVIEFTIIRKSGTPGEYSETYRGIVSSGNIVVRSTLTGRQWVFGV